MRLIDADELAKKWTIASPEPYNTDAVEVLDSIREAPTVDAVVVTRCKDCARYRMGVCMKVYTDGDMFSARCQERKPDDFCSYGESKETTQSLRP